MRRSISCKCLFLLVLAGPAHAALTAPEAAVIRAIADSVRDVASAERALEGQGAEVAGPLLFVVDASDDLSRGFAILLGVNPENEGARDRVAAWDAKPRSEQVHGQYGGWWYVTRAAGGYWYALTRLRALPQTAGIREAVTWLEAAYTRLEGLDVTLPFADPYPRPLRNGVYPVFGPHGDYRDAQKTLYAGLTYLRDDARGEVQRAVMGQRNAFGSPFVHYSIAATSWHRAMALLAGVTWTAQEAAESEACRVIRAMELLSDDRGRTGEAVPFRMHFMRGTRFTDAWFHLDRVWIRMLWLPGCAAGRP